MARLLPSLVPVHLLNVQTQQPASRAATVVLHHKAAASQLPSACAFLFLLLLCCRAPVMSCRARPVAQLPLSISSLPIKLLQQNGGERLCQLLASNAGLQSAAVVSGLPQICIAQPQLVRPDQGASTVI